MLSSDGLIINTLKWTSLKWDGYESLLTNVKCLDSEVVLLLSKQ